LEARSIPTAQRYGREVREFLHFAERARGPFPDGLLHISPAECLAFVALKEVTSESSRAVRAAVLRALFGCLVLEGLRAENPAAEIKVRRISEARHHKAVPKSTVLRVLAHLRESKRVKDIRDYALLVTMLATGARRSEVASWKVSSIERTEDGTAYLNFAGKGRKAARMLLREGAVRALDRWLEVGGHKTNSDAPLFYNLSHRPEHKGRQSLNPEGVYFIIKKHLGRYSPHGLRARAITDVWQNSDGNLHFAQLFGRHSSPGVTEKVYVQAQKLEQAMQYAPNYE
jgi:integrase